MLLRITRPFVWSVMTTRPSTSGVAVLSTISLILKIQGTSDRARENRRSMPRIIERANTFAASITPVSPRPWSLVRPGKGPQFIPGRPTIREEEAEIVATLVKNMHKRGYRYRDIAILLRSVRTSSEPFMAESQGRYPANAPAEPALPATGSTGAGHDHGLALTIVNGVPLVSGQARRVDLEILLKDYKQVFSVNGKSVNSCPPILKNGRYRLMMTRSMPISSKILGLLQKLGVQKWDMTDAVTAARRYSARFSALLADYENSRRRSRWVHSDDGPVFRGSQGGKWYYIHLFTFIQWYCLDAFEDYDNNDEFEVDAVTISTVHQAKGLEWSSFLSLRSWRRFPSCMTGRAGTWWVAEERFLTNHGNGIRVWRTMSGAFFRGHYTRTGHALFIQISRQKTKWESQVSWRDCPW